MCKEDLLEIKNTHLKENITIHKRAKSMMNCKLY